MQLEALCLDEAWSTEHDTIYWWLQGDELAPLVVFLPSAFLSVVYRLWAGVRQQEMMEWQERWEHPLTSGVRPARGVADGAACT